MKDTNTSGAAKKTSAKPRANTAAPKTAAKPAPNSQAVKTAAKAKAPAASKTGKTVTKDMAKPVKPAAKPAAKTTDKAATPKAAVPELLRREITSSSGAITRRTAARKLPSSGWF